MSEAADVFERRLLAIFAGEARVHLDHVDAGVALLWRGGAAAPLTPMQEALHTLGGAARSVGLGELEWLCAAFESVLAAAARGGARFEPAQLDLVGQAAALARQLIEAPAGRRQALALIGQLDALARVLAAPPAPRGGGATDPSRHPNSH